MLFRSEPLALRRLARMVGELPGVEVVGAVADGDAALAAARRLKPDLLILDIEMPGRSGLDVATALAWPWPPQVVILTAFDRYATDAFAIEATDYLLKPLRPDRLRVAVARAQRRLAAATALRRQGPGAGDAPGLPVLEIPGGADVPLADIIWVEAARDYVLVHTAIKSHMLRSTMAEMAGRLPAGIPRVHRSAFANVDYVQAWESPDKGVVRLRLADGAEVPVGPSYVAGLKPLLQARLG